jgi:hypothetical protein
MDSPQTIEQAQQRYVETDPFEYGIVELEDDLERILQMPEEERVVHEERETGNILDAFLTATEDVMQAQVDLTNDMLDQTAKMMGMSRKEGESDEELKSRVKRQTHREHQKLIEFDSDEVEVEQTHDASPISVDLTHGHGITKASQAWLLEFILQQSDERYGEFPMGGTVNIRVEDCLFEDVIVVNREETDQGYRYEAEATELTSGVYASA